MDTGTLRLRKEWRTLSPICGLTVLAMVLERALGGALGHGAVEGFEITTLAAGCAFMGAATFAEEFQDRTMSLLLSHPVPRRDIWFQKLKVLAAGLAIVYTFFLVCTGVQAGTLALGLIPVVVLFTGPGMGIWARSTFMGALNILALPFALWLAMLAGYALVLWVYPDGGNALAAAFDKHPEPFVLIPAAIYCPVLYRFSYRWFLNLELIDSNMAGPEVKLPARLDTALGNAIKQIIPGYTSTLSSLFRKELRLQKPVFVLAGFLCAVEALVLIAAMMHPFEIFEGLLAATPVACILVIPLVAAGMAVAEERGMGIIAWQRSLPPSAATQWLVKLAVVIGTAVLLGLLLPAVMVNVWFLVNRGTLAVPIPHDPQTASIAFNVICGFGLFTSLALFASSASASSLKAILLAQFLLMATATCGFGPVAGHVELFQNDDPGTLLTNAILYGLPWVMIPTILLALLLGYRNSRQIEVTGRQIAMQSILLLLPMGGWGLCLLGIRLIAQQALDPTPL